MTLLTPLRKRVIAMEVSTVIVALISFFDRNPADPFNEIFYHNGIACLLLGLLATTVFAMPSWGLAGALKRMLRWREGSRLLIVPACWLVLLLVVYHVEDHGSAGISDVLRFTFRFSLISLAYGIPAWIVEAVYPDKPAGFSRADLTPP